MLGLGTSGFLATGTSGFLATGTSGFLATGTSGFLGTGTGLGFFTGIGMGAGTTAASGDVDRRGFTCGGRAGTTSVLLAASDNSILEGTVDVRGLARGGVGFGLILGIGLGSLIGSDDTSTCTGGSTVIAAAVGFLGKVGGLVDGLGAALGSVLGLSGDGTESCLSLEGTFLGGSGLAEALGDELPLSTCNH